jgi:hypothetical protein
MYKPLTLVACAACFLLRNVSSAQDELTLALIKDSKKDSKTINILSLDGKNRRVHIMPDYANHVFKISCLKDTITIKNFWGVPAELHVLDSHFIQINYDVRGGSGLGLGNTMLLCVRNKKLYRSFFALRYIDVLLDRSQGEGKYNIKLRLNSGDQKSYKLFVKVHDKRYTKLSPNENYNYNDQIVLNFDPRLNVFYELKETLFQNYDTISSSTGGKQKLTLDDYYPVIILGKETYYFIKNEWFVPSKPGELEAFE